MKVEDGSLEDTLRSDLDIGPDFPIFVPAITYTKGKRKFTIQLMEGYVFVASGLPETDYFNLERKSYITQVIAPPSGPHQMRVLSTIPNSKILDLRRQFQELITSDIELYDKVRVIDGTYRGLEGTVLGRDHEHAFVEIDLRSLKAIATVPLVFLESNSDEG